jgi:hypothetical protein
MQQSDIDPDLVRQLDAARADEPVEAVLLLRPADDEAEHPSTAEALMQRVCRHDHEAQVNYLPRLGALIVRARSRVIRMLINRPEVEMASANRVELAPASRADQNVGL